MRGRVKPSLHQTVARAETAASTNTGSLSHGERAGVRGRVKPSLHQTRSPARNRGIDKYWLPLPWGEGWGEGSGQTIIVANASKSTVYFQQENARRLRRTTGFLGEVD